jgi:hypothetical protein
MNMGRFVTFIAIEEKTKSLLISKVGIPHKFKAKKNKCAEACKLNKLIFHGYKVDDFVDTGKPAPFDIVFMSIPYSNIINMNLHFVIFPEDLAELENVPASIEE